jgi:hypothetical protein
VNENEVHYRHADGSIEVVTEHCYHHSHNSECGAEYGDCDDDANDDCVCCPCCCTCLGCEYGPRDGMLMYPDGPAPWLAEIEAAQGGAA